MEIKLKIKKNTALAKGLRGIILTGYKSEY
jgi:hypothetical protein